MAKEFTLFPLLPSDIRFLIWELTFTPRILSFTYDDEASTDPSSGRDWDSIAFSRLFALPSTTIQPAFDLPGPLSGIATESNIALEVCRESRSFALKAGYREWTQIVPSGRMTMFWNPAYDTVSLPEFFDSRRRQHVFVLIDGFCRQFPDQAREVRYLAVPSCLWNYEESEGEGEGVSMNERMVGKWRVFECLREIAILLDEGYETYREDLIAERIPEEEEVAAAAHCCVFPDDVVKGLQEGKKARAEWKDWRVPRVRLVGDEEGVLKGESLQMMLRCDPCPDLRRFMASRYSEMLQMNAERDSSRNSLEVLIGAQFFRNRFHEGRFI
ncbi:hypothetical protein EG329_014106 [Mollisiaceae sp. DMI_Dod_QoI]|nr:hypothetical protein EG329_014106 [Helotiales sp. DMI_Dod_QoI]